MNAQILIRIVGKKRSKPVQLIDFAQIDRTVLSIKVVQDKDRFLLVLPYISVYLVMLFEDRYKTSSGNGRMVFAQADQLFIMIENRILVFQCSASNSVSRKRQIFLYTSGRETHFILYGFTLFWLQKHFLSLIHI